MVDAHIFESLILTNTIVAAFCVVLLIIFIVFILVLLVPSFRRRWFSMNEKETNQVADLSSLSRQPSFQNLSSGSSRFNPVFEPTAGATTTTTTQFGTLFHPQATTATLLHPTVWTPMNTRSVLSSPLSVRATPTPPILKKSLATPPVPSHFSTTGPAMAAAAQRSPKKR